MLCQRICKSRCTITNTRYYDAHYLKNYLKNLHKSYEYVAYVGGAPFITLCSFHSPAQSNTISAKTAMSGTASTLYYCFLSILSSMSSASFSPCVIRFPIVLVVRSKALFDMPSGSFFNSIRTTSPASLNRPFSSDA